MLECHSVLSRDRYPASSSPKVYISENRITRLIINHGFRSAEYNILVMIEDRPSTSLPSGPGAANR
jgi:hypothetical protein